MKSGLYDDIVAPKKTGLYDDIVKPPPGYRAPGIGGAMAALAAAGGKRNPFSSESLRAEFGDDPPKRLPVQPMQGGGGGENPNWTPGDPKGYAQDRIARETYVKGYNDIGRGVKDAVGGVAEFAADKAGKLSGFLTGWNPLHGNEKEIGRRIGQGGEDLANTVLDPLRQLTGAADDESTGRLLTTAALAGAGEVLSPVLKAALGRLLKGGGKEAVTEVAEKYRPKGEPPVVPKPKVETPAGDAQGVSHAHVDALREEMGWKPRKGTSKPDAQLFEDSKKYQGKETALTEKILGKDADSTATLADEESLALGQKLKSLKSEMKAAREADDFEAYDLADTEAQRIADALDTSGTRQGQAFRARQFLAKDEFDAWTFERKVKKANLGEDLTDKKAKVKDKYVQELESTNETLVKERDAAVKNYELLLGATKSKRSKGPLTAQQKRNSALTSLRKLGVPVTEDFTKAGPVTGGAGSKEAGAIFMPGGVTEDIAKHVRSLVRSYADEGATMWIDKKGLGRGVMERLQRDLPGIEENEALFILSGNYKQAKLKADIAKKVAYDFMTGVKRDAQFRAKPLAHKALQVGLDFLNTTQRGLQTTLDNSMALIQGKNVLTWKPGTWLKSVGTSLKAVVQKDPINWARKELAEIENHPLYSEAVQAKLGLSDLDGAFHRQEEALAGALENHVPGLSHSKAMATVLMNKMRWDLFRKMAAQAPKAGRAEYLADIAQQINIATGKGTGRLAQSLGSREAGLVAYAPRYYLSKWQHNFGAPLLLAKTSAGRKQALKMYGTQLAFYGGLIKASQLAGFEVELDPRSANFGVASGPGYSFDLFKQQSEPIRVMAQFVFGRISKKGKYTAPGDYGDYGPGDYLESKLSAIGRTAMTATTGMTFDEQTGERRVANVHDFWRSYVPLALKEMLKNSDHKETWPLSFFGGNVDKPTQKGNDAPPLKLWPPPGLERMLKGG